MRRLIIALAGLLALAPVALATQLSLTGAGPSSVSSTTYPLDGISGLGAVYSLRQMQSGYTGNCARLRRASDSSEQTFSLSGGVCDPSGIATFCASTTCYFVTLYDQSGNGVDLGQSTTSKQPQYVASGIGSLPTLRFDGTNDYLVSGAVAASTVVNTNQGTFLIVDNQVDGSATHNTFYFGDATDTVRFSLDAAYSYNIYFDFGSFDSGRVFGSVPGGWDGASHVVEGYRTTSDSQEVLADGNSVASGGSKTATMTGASLVLQLGASTQTPALYFNGDVSEFIILKTDVGSSARSSIRTNEGTYYGITVTP